MKIPSTEFLFNRYISYFDKVDSEIFDKIYEWVDRDLYWFYAELAKSTKQTSKVVRDFVGTAGQLKRALSLKK